ncbi:translation initiation factor IF-2-like isoform X2 [Aquila chrysaetos chrysaetos]|uniref:translation initiation factor IF-2-like isoform X1 n=1 Tax=Aquila chrysaetos chrysaetos TaxID=223781 RepID=UPI00117674F2|nr:translation initiation factor IF-2-like isoform X1 [Aquila chrysaetos chrysaetos]XP_029891821.1 translation initiation factor IF-2-like isoform X2 [Aquila chrysaetos chrysaetos]
MSPPCLDFAGNRQPPPTPPHTPFVPGQINVSEELGKGVTPEGQRRREGRAPLTTPRPGGRGCAPGARREGAGAGRGVLQDGGSLPRRERGAPRPESGAGGGGGGGQSGGLSGRACRTAGCGEGAAAPAGGQQRQAGAEGRERGSWAAEEAGARRQGPGRCTARSLRRAGPYFAAETLLSADNGAGCLLRAGRQLAIHRERCVTQMSRGS